MKSAIVYYSLDGHTRLIADMIASETGADVFELVPAKDNKKTGFQKYFWGGKSVMFNEKPGLKNPSPDLSAYDLIYIGTPIWASSFTPPVNTFISNAHLQGKKLAFFACHSGGGAVKCFDKMEKLLKNNAVTGKIDFKDPSADKAAEIAAAIKEWLASFA
jgi:flavodoxin